jgi:hypothetical protein
MIRLPDWQSRLSSYVTRNATTRFKYAEFDCGLFVAGAIEATTGLDVARELKGCYTNRTEAFVAIKTLCGTATMEALGEFLAAKNGFPEVPVLMAQRGDAVMLRHGRRSSLGIVSMLGSEILTPYKDGLLRLPLSHATRAWHI